MDSAAQILSRTRIATAMTLLFALAVGGCTPKPAGASISDAFAGRRTESQASSSPLEGDNAGGPAAAASGDDAIATVNGQAISRDWLTRALIQTHGLELLVLKISVEVARQEAARQGVEITTADVDREYDLALKVAESGGGVTPQRRQQLIDRWLMSRGVSAEELRLAMNRQALLRKLAERRMPLTESAERDEFARLYGAKVEIRHIELASQRDIDRVRPYVEAGEEFAMLARRFSVNELTASKGGLLPPFTRYDETIPGGLREAAFSMEPGQVSNPIKVDSRYHLIRVERRITPEVIKFEDVRPAVQRSLRERMLAPEMERLSAELQQRAVLTIRDEVLRNQYSEAVQRGRVVGPTPR